jgi:hypothetical protein
VWWPKASTVAKQPLLWLNYAARESNLQLPRPRARRSNDPAASSPVGSRPPRHPPIAMTRKRSGGGRQSRRSGCGVRKVGSVCGSSGRSGSSFGGSVLTETGSAGTVTGVAVPALCDKARRGSAASSAVRKNCKQGASRRPAWTMPQRLKGYPGRNSSRSPRGLNPTTGAGSRQS